MEADDCPGTTEISVDGTPLDTLRCGLTAGHRGWHKLLGDDGRTLVAWPNRVSPDNELPPEVNEALMSHLQPRIAPSKEENK